MGRIEWLDDGKILASCLFAITECLQLDSQSKKISGEITFAKIVLLLLRETTTESKMKKFFFPIIMVMALGFSMMPMLPTQTAHADDFIDLDLSGVAPAARGAFRRAERFWESRINGYSNTLPQEIRSQLNGRLFIDADTVPIDGPGNILGQANSDVRAEYFELTGPPGSGQFAQWSVPIAGFMEFDVADAALPGFDEVVRHEMAHVLGIGSLWAENGIFNASGTRSGLLQQTNTGFQYVGKHGLAGFKRSSGHTRATYVPVEQGGGPGTGLAHWDSNNWHFNPRFGNRSELMIGFLGGRTKFVSEATWGALADVGWAVDGFNPGAIGSVGVPGRPIFPKTSRSFAFALRAVPEPSSAVMILFSAGTLLLRRRRQA